MNSRFKLKSLEVSLELNSFRMVAVAEPMTQMKREDLEVTTLRLQSKRAVKRVKISKERKGTSLRAN